MMVILEKVVVEEEIDHSIRVRWFVPLNATYVHYRIASILYKIDIYGRFMGRYGQTSCFPKSLPQFI
jgi:hypothetical protein